MTSCSIPPKLQMLQGQDWDVSAALACHEEVTCGRSRSAAGPRASVAAARAGALRRPLLALAVTPQALLRLVLRAHARPRAAHPGAPAQAMHSSSLQAQAPITAHTCTPTSEQLCWHSSTACRRDCAAGYCMKCARPTLCALLSHRQAPDREWGPIYCAPLPRRLRLLLVLLLRRGGPLRVAGQDGLQQVLGHLHVSRLHAWSGNSLGLPSHRQQAALAGAWQWRLR